MRDGMRRDTSGLQKRGDKRTLDHQVAVDRKVAFAKAYVTHWDTMLAMRQARPQSYMSDVTARHRGNEMLQDPEVQALIAEEKSGLIIPQAITRERVLVELARVAFADVRKLVERKEIFDAVTKQTVWVDVPRDVSTLDDDTAAAVSSIGFDNLGRPRLKMADKLPALRALAEVTGALPDQAARLAKDVFGRGHDALGDDEIRALLEEHVPEAVEPDEVLE